MWNDWYRDCHPICFMALTGPCLEWFWNNGLGGQIVVCVPSVSCILISSTSWSCFCVCVFEFAYLHLLICIFVFFRVQSSPVILNSTHSEKCRYAEVSSWPSWHLWPSWHTGMSYLISLNPLHLDDIAHVGSYRYLKNPLEFWRNWCLHAWSM